MSKYRIAVLASAISILTSGTFAADAPACQPVVSGIKFACPVGWQIVDEDHPPKAVTLGNYPRNPDRNQWTITPAGKSTIQILPLPGLYRTLKEWIEATEHSAVIDVPENSKHEETSETFQNPTEGKIAARCFTSPPRTKQMGDRGCIFAIRGVPVMVDANFTRDTNNVDEVKTLVGQMIQSARPARN